MNSEIAIKNLINKNITISTAESATAGGIVSRIGDVAGASNILKESFVTYSNEAKIRILSVNEDTINKYGVVSKEVAIEMVKGLYNITHSDLCISITGSFGPTTYDNTKVGDVYIGMYYNNKLDMYFENFIGDRLLIKEKTINRVFELIADLIGLDYE